MSGMPGFYQFVGDQSWWLGGNPDAITTLKDKVTHVLTLFPEIKQVIISMAAGQRAGAAGCAFSSFEWSRYSQQAAHSGPSTLGDFFASLGLSWGIFHGFVDMRNAPSDPEGECGATTTKEFAGPDDPVNGAGSHWAEYQPLFDDGMTLIKLDNGSSSSINSSTGTMLRRVKSRLWRNKDSNIFVATEAWGDDGAGNIDQDWAEEMPQLALHRDAYDLIGLIPDRKLGCIFSTHVDASNPSFDPTDPVRARNMMRRGPGIVVPWIYSGSSNTTPNNAALIPVIREEWLVRLETFMATLGLDKLQAVNQMLFDLDGEPPVSALDPGGASIEAEAETALDYVNEIIQTRGWPDNTNFADELTAGGDGGSMTITVPETTLAIRGVAPHLYADITLQGDLVYDNRSQTTIFPDNQAIFVDIVREVAYANLTPKLKHLILQIAKQYFSRRKKGDPQIDEWLAEEVARLDPGTPRHPIEIPTDNRRVIEPQERSVRESTR